MNLSQSFPSFTVNEEVAQTQKKTAKIRDELKSLQGSLAIQNNKVAEQELQLKWLKEKERIMKLQKHTLEETKLELQNTLVLYSFYLQLKITQKDYLDSGSRVMQRLKYSYILG